MATINNSKIQERIAREAKIQLSVDSVPNQLAEKVVPVLVSNPDKHCLSASVSSTSTGNTTVYAGGTRQVYICSASISTEDDAVSDATLIRLNAVINGQSKDLIKVAKLTTSAGKRDHSITFPIPVKIDLGTNVTLIQSFSAGTENASANITYYEVD